MSTEQTATHKHFVDQDLGSKAGECLGQVPLDWPMAPQLGNLESENKFSESLALPIRTLLRTLGHPSCSTGRLKVVKIKNLRVGYSRRTGFLYRLFTVLATASQFRFTACLRGAKDALKGSGL